MHKPEICSIELFRRCCLRCRMCYMWKQEDLDNILDRANLSRFADQLQEVLAGSKEVVFSGGEPLLFEGISDLIFEYAQKGFKVGLASNGVLINNEVATQLAEAGLKNIQLSFDSCYQKTHDFLRGVDGVHEKVLKAAGHLSRYKDRLSICAQTVISGKNINEIIDTIKFVKDDPRFDFISFMAVTTPFFAPVDEKWRSSEEFSFLWPKEEKKVDLVIDQIIDMKRDGYPIANPVSQFEVFRSYFHDPQRRKAGQKCSLGNYIISVDPQGDVRLCCFMRPVGNVGRETLTESLAARAVDELREKMKDCQRTCNTLVNCFFQE